MSNVINLPSPDLTEIYIRSGAGLRALHNLEIKIRTAFDAAKTEWNKATKEALKAFIDPMVADFDAIVGHETVPKGKRDAYADNYLRTVKGVAVWEKAKADAKASDKEFNDRLGKVATAKLECIHAGRVNVNQGDLFGVAAAVDGLGWATASTRQAMFTALKEMTRDGKHLDPFQAQLLLDLGGAGIDELDLGLSASEAVEADGVEAEPSASSDDDDSIGF